VGYNSVQDIWSIVIRLAIVAIQNREIAWNSDKIWPYQVHPRSSVLVSTGSSYATSY